MGGVHGCQSCHRWYYNDICQKWNKNESINTIFWNHILASIKYKINTRQWVIYNICGFINNFCISCWWYKKRYFATSWISNVAFPSICTRKIKFSSNNWRERKLIIYLAKKNIKFCAKDFVIFLTLTGWAINTS